VASTNGTRILVRINRASKFVEQKPLLRTKVVFLLCLIYTFSPNGNSSTFRVKEEVEKKEERSGFFRTLIDISSEGRKSETFVHDLPAYQSALSQFRDLLSIE